MFTITYNQLLALTQNYTINNSPEFLAAFPSMVNLAEVRIIRDLDLAIFDTTISGVLVSGNSALAKPEDLIVQQDLFITINNQRTYLQLRSKGWIQDYWRDLTQTATPQYFAEDTQTAWLLGPTPDSPYPYTLNYTQRPEPMSITNQTTWIGNTVPECLMYAVYTGAMGYVREDVTNDQGQTQLWERSYMSEMAKARMELSMMRGARDNELFSLTKTQQ